MAKPKSEKSQATKQLDKLKADLKQAKKKLAEKNIPTHVKAVTDLQYAIASVQETVNRERFERVANVRAQKALSGIKGLQAVANPRSYKFSQDDVDVLVNALTDELAVLTKKFATALAGAGEKKTKAVTGNIFAKPTQAGKE